MGKILTLCYNRNYMRILKYLFFFLFVVTFSSCKLLRSNLMLKTPPDYSYDKLEDSLSRIDYKIEPNDLFELKVFTNDGFKIIDLTTSAGLIRNYIDYRIERDGTVKLPLIGNYKLAGLTLREAESKLEELYANYYVKPYANLKIINKRVTVFPGNAGTAKVIYLTNNNTSVIEAIAYAGGITDDGKAYKVKLIRNDGTPKPKVYLIDLSTIEGVTAGRTAVLANDIIYVEPRYRLARTLVTEVAPILSLLSTTILLYTVFKK